LVGWMDGCLVGWLVGWLDGWLETYWYNKMWYRIHVLKSV
jgi:hypothetical protein